MCRLRSSRSGSLRANQLWAKGEASEHVFPVSMIVLFRMETEINFQIRYTTTLLPLKIH